MPARGRFLWRVALPLIRGVGKTFFSLRVEREAALPAPPFVLAANHYSHLDGPTIAAAVNSPISYLALEDLFEANRLLDWLIVGFGAIPTPRHRVPVGAIRTALAALKAGEIVGVFPEATRVTHWQTLPPKRGAAWLAKRAGVPLIPVAVVGSGQAFGLENRLRRAPIRIVIGRALQPEHVDTIALTEQWAEWMTSQIKRYPGSEVSGPRRSHHSGS